MGFQYAVINKETKETVGTFSWLWLKDFISCKENLLDMIVECRKAMDKCKSEVAEIRNFQENLYPETKQKVLEQINGTENLIELLNKIELLRDEYSRKSFTFYREDEIYYAQITVQNLEAFEKWLLGFEPLDKYFGQII